MPEIPYKQQELPPGSLYCVFDANGNVAGYLGRNSMGVGTPIEPKRYIVGGKTYLFIAGSIDLDIPDYVRIYDAVFEPEKSPEPVEDSGLAKLRAELQSEQSAYGQAVYSGANRQELQWRRRQIFEREKAVAEREAYIRSRDEYISGPFQPAPPGYDFDAEPPLYRLSERQKKVAGELAMRPGVLFPVSVKPIAAEESPFWANNMPDASNELTERALQQLLADSPIADVVFKASPLFTKAISGGKGIRNLFQLVEPVSESALKKTNDEGLTKASDILKDPRFIEFMAQQQKKSKAGTVQPKVLSETVAEQDRINRILKAQLIEVQQRQLKIKVEKEREAQSFEQKLRLMQRMLDREQATVKVFVCSACSALTLEWFGDERLCIACFRSAANRGGSPREQFVVLVYADGSEKRMRLTGRGAVQESGGRHPVLGGKRKIRGN